MLNKRPIFINAFGRGGSNIIMNLLLSHPKVCVSSGETHKVFKGTKWDTPLRKLKKRLWYDLPIRLFTGQDYFGEENYEERKPISFFLKKHIDSILYHGRFYAVMDTHNYFKYENVPYTKEELSKCRLLTKGLNGIAYTADMFNELYDDAVFFGLIRNGLAICEGYVRRGASAKNVAEIYRTVVQKMINLDKELPNYYLVKYEDMVEDPYAFAKKIYAHAGLEISELKKIRLQSKKVMGADGKRDFVKGGDRELFWYKPDDLSKYVRKDINENQIRQLNENDKETFIAVAGDAMKALGYY